MATQLPYGGYNGYGSRPSHSGAGFPWLWMIVAVIIAALFAIAAGMFFDAIEPVDPAATISPEVIADSPGRFYGASVTVRSEVNEVIGRQAFALGDVLVVSAEPVSPTGQPRATQERRTEPAAMRALAEGDRVVVVGRVRRFNLTSLESEIDADLDDGRFAPYAGRPVIVARSVARS